LVLFNHFAWHQCAKCLKVVPTLSREHITLYNEFAIVQVARVVLLSSMGTIKL